MVRTRTLTIRTNGPGLTEFTGQAEAHVAGSGVAAGVLALHVRHTSASLLIQENADPDVRADLRAFFERLAPRASQAGMEWITHRSEGPDDMPAHIRAAVLPTNLTVPIVDGRLSLGTWQGIYLFEHRDRPHRREVVLCAIGEATEGT